MLKSERQKGVNMSKKMNSLVDSFPDLDNLLDFFATSFDATQARRDGF